MRFTSIVSETVQNKKLPWVKNPEIGFLAESPRTRLYYGCDSSKLKTIFREGIFAAEDGYIMCSAEPYTALSHATMRQSISESIDDTTRCVVVVDIPLGFFDKQELVIENDSKKRFTNQKLYEEWGRADCEYYALIGVRVPDHIPVSWIQGWMTK